MIPMNVVVGGLDVVSEVGRQCLEEQMILSEQAQMLDTLHTIVIVYLIIVLH